MELTSMFIYDFVVIDTPFDHVWAPFAALPPHAIAGALGEAVTAPTVPELHRRPDRLRDDAVVIDLNWVSPAVTTTRLARFEGELQCAPLASGRSHLSLSGSYELGSESADASDRVRQHREVEAQMRGFLRALRAALRLDPDTESTHRDLFP
jgi:hypothetical protein